MPTQTALSTLTADSNKGRKATDLFRHAYNACGLDEERAQVLNENKGFPGALRRIIAECSMSIVAPKGGRIHIVRVLVDPVRPWREAINAVGSCSQTELELGELYSQESGEPREREIILVNFGKDITGLQHALDWAVPYGLLPEMPRGVFAISEYKPQLRQELRHQTLRIISPVPCYTDRFHLVPTVWSDRSGRRVDTLQTDAYFAVDHSWFAFSRE